MLSETLGLSSSLAVGTADFIAGLQTRRQQLLTVMTVSQLASVAALLPLAWIFEGAPPSPRSLALALAAGLLLPLGMAALFSALALGKMGVVAPITGTSAVVPVVAGIIAGERPAALQIAGIVLCIGGVVLVAAQADSAPDSSAADRRSVLLAILTVPIIGFMVVLLAGAGGPGEDLWAVTYMRGVSCALTCVAALVHGAAVRDSLHAHFPPLIAVGLLDAVGLVMFLTATDTGLLSVSAVLFSLYPAVTVLLARVLLAERLRSVQIAGAMTILVGIAALALG